MGTSDIAGAMITTRGDVSLLLERILGGDMSAEEQLVNLLYGDLRRMAAHQLRNERSDHTLQPTALVNEIFEKVFRQNRPEARSRAHFIAVAARIMRHCLVDHARTKKAEKRGHHLQMVPIENALVYDERRSDEFLAVHDALERLREWAPRQAQIVEMRYFGGMSEDEIADYLKTSTRTVKREWAMARAWLHAELSA